MRVVVGAAQSNYVGSTANAISSSSYGTYSGSYTVSNEAGSNALIAYPGMPQNPIADPGSLTAYRGRTLASIYFNVTGSLSGGVWGTGIYTDDSVLAAAAVHAGLLRPGQSGIVKVTIRNGLSANAAGVAYVGSVANGITSNSFGSYTASFSLSSPDGGLGSIARVTNAGIVRALVLVNLGFQIATSPLATSFDATGLPAGLAINASSGLITGAALVSGDFPVQLLASNAEGTSNDTLLIRISEAASNAITPRQLDLIGPLTLQAGAKTIVSATARYLDNSLKTVAPLWISSVPGVATVSTLGVLKAGSVAVDTVVIVTAFWREIGATVQSTLRVTITAAPATLTGLKVVGQNAVQSGGKLRLQLVAIYRDGSVRQVIPSSVAVSDAALGSINPARGEFTAGVVSADALVTVSAQYTEGGVSQSASLLIRIGSAPATLQRLAIIGARGVLASGKVLNLTAEGLYQDGSRKAITATWQVFGSAATISAAGVLTAQTVSTGTPILVTARYTDTAGISVTAQFVMVIQAVEPVTPIDAEVESTGPKGDSGLSVWSRLVAPASGQPGAPTTRDASAQTSPVYNMYVAAIVPAGGVLGLPTQSIFLLNRSQEWQALGSPLAEYVSGVADNSFQLIELFDHLDATIISGTQIYVGYGITDTEMLAAGRVRLVYLVQ